MALSTADKIKVISNHTDVTSLNFVDTLKIEMCKHAYVILFEEDDTTYLSLPYGRKALVDLAKNVIDRPDAFVSGFTMRYANDSNVTWGTLITKIPDVVPAIYPDIAGVIQFDRPA